MKRIAFVLLFLSASGIALADQVKPIEPAPNTIQDPKAARIAELTEQLQKIVSMVNQRQQEIQQLTIQGFKIQGAIDELSKKEKPKKELKKEA